MIPAVIVVVIVVAVIVAPAAHALVVVLIVVLTVSHGVLFNDSSMRGVSLAGLFQPHRRNAGHEKFFGLAQSA